jgi:hypothetical protein
MCTAGVHCLQQSAPDCSQMCVLGHTAGVSIAARSMRCIRQLVSTAVPTTSTHAPFPADLNEDVGICASKLDV